jgi:hypothetical protein
MFSLILFLQAPASALPGYALGQPLEEARQVRPPGEAGEGWTLICTGDPAAPAELASDSRGIMVCWPMKRVNREWERVGYPKRGAARVETALHIIKGVVERIETTRIYPSGETISFVKKRG